MAEPYKVYVIRAAGPRSAVYYVGKTNDLRRRIRQHNREISGGARATARASGWEYVLVIDGFGTNSQAMQAEWRIKRARREERPSDVVSWLGRCCSTRFSAGLGWTSRSPPPSEQALVALTDESPSPPEGWPPNWKWIPLGSQMEYVLRNRCLAPQPGHPESEYIGSHCSQTNTTVQPPQTNLPVDEHDPSAL